MGVFDTEIHDIVGPDPLDASQQENYSERITLKDFASNMYITVPRQALVISECHKQGRRWKHFLAGGYNHKIGKLRRNSRVQIPFL